MSVKFQYNKISLKNLEKQLKIRQTALPILKNKEAALRLEVQKVKKQINELQIVQSKVLNKLKPWINLWCEFEDELLTIKEVKIEHINIAGTNIPVLEDIIYSEIPYCKYTKPLWFPVGIEYLKQINRIEIKSNVFKLQKQILNKKRLKTTQKVNLYEKVQIPEYQKAILKIKRFLEDEENISKAGQKILKTRILKAEQNL